MSSNAELHLLYKIANAPLNVFPFPHLYIRDVFPADYYAELQSMLPDPRSMVTISEARPVSPGPESPSWLARPYRPDASPGPSMPI